MKKYMLTNDTIKIGRKTLHRIVALRDFDDIEAGDLGGYIEKESNLSHEGNCWVGDNAQVYGNAEVLCDARVYENAKVYGNARVYNSAQVHGNAQVYDYAQVKEDSEIYDNAKVYGEAEAFAMADICDDAQVYGRACIFGSIYGSAKVYGVCEISNHSSIDENAEISGYSDYGTISGFGPSGNSDISFFKTTTGEIRIGVTGRFHGTLEEFEEKIKKTEDDKYRKQYEIIVELIKAKFM